MSFKEIIDQEKADLTSVKRPYETAAFIIFAVMFIQQIGYWILRISQHMKAIKAAAGAWNPAFNTNLPTTPAFVRNLISIDATKWLWIFVGLLGLVLWYFLIYLFVWSYCKKHGYAKWVWTALIAFGPTTILFIPIYLIYAVYVFRPYLFRFIKRGVQEYQSFDSNHQFDEEKEEPKEEPKETVKESRNEA